MGYRTKALAAFATAALMVIGCGGASATVINFDNLVGGTNLFNGTPVTNQYAGLGVTFDDGGGNQAVATLGTVPAYTGYSGPNILFVQQHFSSPQVPLKMIFSVPTNNVGMDVFQSAGVQFTMAAYSSGGTLLGSMTYPGDPNYGVGHFFSISEPSAIGYVLVTSNFGAFNFGIDNVTFDSPAVPEPLTLSLFAAGVAVVMRRRRRA